jgi:CIC family chloride channel protein
LAGAGLGVAFSAPLGGAVFVLEELERAVRTRLLVAVLIASSVALAVAYPLVGRHPVLPVPPQAAAPTWQLPLFVLLGLVAGVMGVYYSRLIIWNLDQFERLRRVPAEVKAAVIGAVVGLLGVVAPWLIGGGEILADRVLVLTYPLGALVVVLVVRWFLGPLAYSAGTPGGLFAPMLVLGATVGALFASVANLVLPEALPVTAFAIAGMAAFFTAVVRSPVTGILLCVEMTATTSLLVPMLAAAGTTLVVCAMLRSTPIYDVLRLRMEGRSVRV